MWLLYVVLQYSLPIPKGGRHAHNPILAPDQRVTQKERRSRTSRINPLDPDYIAQVCVHVTWLIPPAWVRTCVLAWTFTYVYTHTFCGIKLWVVRTKNVYLKWSYASFIVCVCVVACNHIATPKVWIACHMYMYIQHGYTVFARSDAALD